MTTTLKLFDGRTVTVEQTITGITAQVDGGEKKAISSEQYMGLIMAGTPVGSVG
jgi:hypothetical protein